MSCRSQLLAAVVMMIAGFVPGPAPGREPEPAGPATVSFRRELAPLLQRRCLTCHNEDSAKGGYRMHTFERLMHPGESELAPIVAGRASESELVHLLHETDGNARMPQKAEPLPKSESDLIERWIDEGAHYDGGAPDRPLVELARETLLRPAPLLYARPSPVTAVAFSPDGTQLAVSGYFEITIWDIASNALVRRIGGLPERISSILWDGATNLLVVGGGSPALWGTVVLVDPNAGFQVRFLCDLPEIVTSVAVARAQSILAAAGGDRTVRIFTLPDGKLVRIVRHHADWVQAIALSDDGNHAASASRDRTVKVFQTRTGELETTYTGHDTPLVDVAFSSNDARIFSIARDRKLHRWNPQSGEREGDLLLFPSEVQRFVVDGDRVISGATDAVVRITQSSDRQTLFALRGHRDVVQAIARSPDGETIATGGADGEVCIWETTCGTWLHRFVASPIDPAIAAAGGAAARAPDAGP